MGFFALLSPGNQDALCWGRPPDCVLHRLMAAPLALRSDPTLSQVSCPCVFLFWAPQGPLPTVQRPHALPDEQSLHALHSTGPPNDWPAAGGPVTTPQRVALTLLRRHVLPQVLLGALVAICFSNPRLCSLLEAWLPPHNSLMLSLGSETLSPRGAPPSSAPPSSTLTTPTGTTHVSTPAASVPPPSLPPVASGGSSGGGEGTAGAAAAAAAGSGGGVEAGASEGAAAGPQQQQEAPLQQLQEVEGEEEEGQAPVLLLLPERYILTQRLPVELLPQVRA